VGVFTSAEAEGVRAVSRLARRPPASRPVIDFFASGLLHTEKDFYGVTVVGGHPGIIAAANIGGRVKYEDKVPVWISTYLQSGGPLFCDSGAFTVAFTGKTLDFNRVFRFYHQLLKPSPTSTASRPRAASASPSSTRRASPTGARSSGQ
jgi:hypothetical protein